MNWIFAVSVVFVCAIVACLTILAAVVSGVFQIKPKLIQSDVLYNHVKTTIGDVSEKIANDNMTRFDTKEPFYHYPVYDFDTNEVIVTRVYKFARVERLKDFVVSTKNAIIEFRDNEQSNPGSIVVSKTKNDLVNEATDYMRPKFPNDLTVRVENGNSLIYSCPSTDNDFELRVNLPSYVVAEKIRTPNGQYDPVKVVVKIVSPCNNPNVVKYGDYVLYYARNFSPSIDVPARGSTEYERVVEHVQWKCLDSSDDRPILISSVSDSMQI